MNIEQQIGFISQILGPKKGEKNHNGKKTPKNVERHAWSIQDEMLAIDLYKRNASETEVLNAIKDTEIKLSSMRMKIKNIEFLDTGKGLNNVSETTKALWDKLK
jgi:hypothetical protein